MRTVFPPAIGIRQQAGFTLIEIFIAMLLLAIGLLGTAALTTGVVRGNIESRNLTNAGTVPTGGSNNCVTGSSTISSGGVSFTRVLAIDASVSNVKTLTVTVSWSEGAIGTKSLTLKTVIAAS
jgi:prepilin-type N-terminal cleavage/methylation domain-containing protein